MKGGRCKNGTRKNKKTGACVEYSKSYRKRCAKGTRKNAHGDCEKIITNEELDDIIDGMNLNREIKEELRKLKPKLKRMKHSKKYKCCFTNEHTQNIREMISSKIQCYAKYGTRI